MQYNQQSKFRSSFQTKGVSVEISQSIRAALLFLLFLLLNLVNSSMCKKNKKEQFSGRNICLFFGALKQLSHDAHNKGITNKVS